LKGLATQNNDSQTPLYKPTLYKLSTERRIYVIIMNNL
jgi:hypothetical protein